MASGLFATPTTQNSISVVNHEYHRRRKTTLETQLHLTGQNEGDRETGGTSKKKSKKKRKTRKKTMTVFNNVY